MRSVPIQTTYGGHMVKGMKSYVMKHDESKYKRDTRIMEWLKENVPGVNVSVWSQDGKQLIGNYAWSVCFHHDAFAMGQRVDSSFKVIRLPRHIAR